MENTIEVLDENSHRDLSIDFIAARKAFCDRLQLPAVISEFHRLMFHYPIVFVKDGTTGEFTCSVMLGVSPQVNLLQEQDVSDDEYLPLNLRRQPLVAIETGDESSPLIGINTAAVGVGQGERLFAGKSAGLDVAIAALGELYRGYKETREFVRTLLELKLLSPLKVEIVYRDKPTLKLEGLYAVDENKISQLIDGESEAKDKFLQIARYAYAQNFSLANLRKFALMAS